MGCRICQHSDGTIHHAREMMFGLLDRFDYFECRRCGCLQLLNPPSNYSRYYPRDYYSFAPLEPPRDMFVSGLRRWLGRLKNSGILFGRRGLPGALAKWRPRPDLAGIRTMLAPTTIRTFDVAILDVGCGNGELLCELAVAGFDRLVGIDPFGAEQPQLAPRVRIVPKPLEVFEGGRFDLIMCHHALEHMPDQHGAMRDFARLLAPSGTVLIRIPLAGSEPWRRYGTDWVELDAPRHTFIHSRASFERLAQEAGFEISHVSYDGEAFGYWGSELYRRGTGCFDPRTRMLRDPAACFTAEEIRAFEQAAAAANERGEAGRAAFYLRLRSAPQKSDRDGRGTMTVHRSQSKPALPAHDVSAVT
jgi:SAM-dependent methyltransferase